MSCCTDGCVATFHKDCGIRALRRSDACPVCRRHVHWLRPAVDSLLELREACVDRYSALERAALLMLRSTLARLPDTTRSAGSEAKSCLGCCHRRGKAWPQHAVVRV